jgi:hypothetical protein
MERVDGIVLLAPLNRYRARAPNDRIHSSLAAGSAPGHICQRDARFPFWNAVSARSDRSEQGCSGFPRGEMGRADGPARDGRR